MEAKPEEFEKIRYAVEGHVATITLDDPDTRNSLSDLLLDELLGLDRQSVAIQPVADGLEQHEQPTED